MAAGEAAGELVVAEAGDIAAETGVIENHPGGERRQQEDDQLHRYVSGDIALAEHLQPWGKARDRIGIGDRVGNAAEEGEGAERDDERLQTQGGDDEMIFGMHLLASAGYGLAKELVVLVTHGGQGCGQG